MRGFKLCCAARQPKSTSTNSAATIVGREDTVPERARSGNTLRLRLERRIILERLERRCRNVRDFSLCLGDLVA